VKVFFRGRLSATFAHRSSPIAFPMKERSRSIGVILYASRQFASVVPVLDSYVRPCPNLSEDPYFLSVSRQGVPSICREHTLLNCAPFCNVMIPFCLVPPLILLRLCLPLCPAFFLTCPVGSPSIPTNSSDFMTPPQPSLPSLFPLPSPQCATPS